MTIRQTHTYAVLGISQNAFLEIKHLLEEAGYGHAFVGDDEIDMHGIGLKAEPPEPTRDDEDQDVIGLPIGSSLQGVLLNIRDRDFCFNPWKDPEKDR